MTAEHGHDALALEQEIAPIPEGAFWSLAIPIALAILAFIALGTVGTKLWYSRGGRSTGH